MKIASLLVAAAASTVLSLALAGSHTALPDTWHMAGSEPDSYEGYRDLDDSPSGKGAGCIRYSQGKDSGFGTIMSSFAPAEFAGQRVRFSARMRFQDVSGRTGLWMRADSPSKAGSAFYNSYDLELMGSRTWLPYQVVLDIPADAHALSYGVLLQGRGEVCIDELKMEIVGSEVPLSTKASPAARTLPGKPDLL